MNPSPPLTAPAPRRRTYRLALLRSLAVSAGLAVAALWRANMGWAIPLFIVLLVLAVTLALLASAGPLAPFVYPLL